jgi:CxxC motif-containing protein (DUF1111 family)
MLSVIALVLLAACDDKASVFDVPVFDTAHLQAGGVTTVSGYLNRAYEAPAAHLGASGRRDYGLGQGIFSHVWEVKSATSTAALDGLGPLYNANSCSACHRRNGRGSVAGEGPLLRLGQLAVGTPGVVGDATYGEQLQHRAVPGLAIEASVQRTWHYQRETLPGGLEVELRTPEFEVSPWFWGTPDKDTAWSSRLAPALIGLGLLAAIPQTSILAESAAQAEKADGISGQPSWVLHRRSGQLRLGRFGWKAQQPTVEQQTAKALQQDMGLSSVLFPQSVCTAAQVACLEHPSSREDGEPEVREAVLDSLVYFVSRVAVPEPRDISELTFQRGRLQFYRAGCVSCHRPTWLTEPALGLATQQIWPFTDMLLHDMGPGLAAPVGEGDVAGKQWRTAPLWGIGLALESNPDTGFLHDGRARNLLEAVLWHGGEAQQASDAVRKMDPPSREALLFFLNAL